MATQTIHKTGAGHADGVADRLPEPVQLSLLGTSRLDPSLRLDLETRRRGMRHIAEIRAMLEERRRQRLDSRDAA